MTNQFDAPALADTELAALIDESGCLTLAGVDSHRVVSADLSGKVLWEVVHPNDIAAVHCAVREVFATGARATIRFRVQDDGGGWQTLEGAVRRLDGEAPTQAMLAVRHVSAALPIAPCTLDAEQQLLESRQGVGTTMTFVIPRADDVPIRAAAGDAAAIEGGTETLLVVEDEARVRELVADMLELAGYDVLAAATPSAAEQVSHDAAGTIHLLLTDIVMPEMSGFELSARLQAHRPDLRVVYMSGYPKPMFAEDGGEMPAARFIAKPFDRQALLRSIRQALDVTDAG